MGVFQTVMKGFSVAAKSIKLWVLLVIISFVLMAVAIPTVLVIFGPSAFQPGVAQPSLADVGAGGIVMFVLLVILSLVIQIFVNAGTVGTVKDTVKSGNLNLAGFVENGKKFFVKFLLFGIVMSLVVGLALIVFILMGGLAGAIGNAVNILGMIIGAVVFIIFVAVMIFLGMYGTVGPIAIVSEEKSLMDSMRKAMDFIKARPWKLLGLLALLGLIFVAAMALIAGLFFIVGLIIGVTTGAPTLSAGAQMGINITSRIIWNLVSTYITLIFISSLISYYLDNPGKA